MKASPVLTGTILQKTDQRCTLSSNRMIKPPMASPCASYTVDIRISPG